MQEGKCDKYSKKILDNKEKNIYIVFYKGGCPFSINALNLLKEKKLEFKGYDLNKKNNKKEIAIECFIANSNIDFDKTHNTVPMIFYKGSFIGGFTELKKFIDTA